MSTTVTAERYEDLVRRSGLVDASHLDNVMGELATEQHSRPLDSHILAKKLIDRQLITAWQNEKLMQGRHKGFFLCQYKLLYHLSKGGMSEVYAAEDTTTRNKVAIKVFPPALIDTSSYLARFQQEARTQQQLDHPNIVRATDFGCAGKIHYLVMEYVDGVDLHRLVESKGPLPYRDAAGYVVQAADALEYAHGRRMIHRDIKPGNLMLDGKGTVKLLDLGLAKILSEEGSLTLKHNENSLGTADYVAPEQAVDSHGVDERADIYSLGGTLYYLLMGNPPFPDGTPVQRMMAHMKDTPVDVRTRRPDAPEGLLAIMGRMMAKRPEERYRSMAEVRRAVQNWLAGGPDEPLPGPANSEESSSNLRSFGVAPGSKLEASGRSGARRNEPRPAPGSSAAAPAVRPAGSGGLPKPAAPSSGLGVPPARPPRPGERPPPEPSPTASTVAGVPAPNSIPSRGRAETPLPRPSAPATGETPSSASRGQRPGDSPAKNAPAPSPPAPSAAAVASSEFDSIPALPMEPVDAALPAFLNEPGLSSNSRSSERSVSLSRNIKKPGVDKARDAESLAAIGGEVGYALGIGIVAALCSGMTMMPNWVVGLGVGALFAGGRLVFSSLALRK